jgi:uncharacterized RDD family membrane protein YckC
MGIISIKYDTLWRRVGAAIIDSFVLAPIGMIAGFLGMGGMPVPILIGSIILQHCSPWIYNVLMHGWRGQTFGKMVARITVLDVTERKMSMTQAFLRESFYVVVNVLSVTLYIKQRFGSGSDPASLARINAVIVFSGFIWFVIEIVTTLFSEKRRALHDHIARTVVVRSEYVKKPFELEQFRESFRLEQSIPQPDRRPASAESYSERRSR